MPPILPRFNAKSYLQGASPVPTANPTGLPAIQGPNRPVQPQSTAGQAVDGALGGVGTYLTNNAAAQASANTAMNGPGGLLNEVSNLRQRQSEDATGAAENVLNQSPAGYDIDPYAQMALKQALAGSYTDLKPGGGGQGGFDLSGAQKVMDQYYSPAAISASMQQQQELRNNVDPYTPQSTTGLQIYPDAGYAGNFGASQAGQGAAQNRQQDAEGASRQALQDAIKGQQDSSKFSWKGLLGSALAGGAKAGLKLIPGL